MKKYHYFYKITNLVNSKYYYGIHSTFNLDDGYMGSGKRLTYAKNKYGIENFKKEILEFFDTRQEALEYESEIVNEKLIIKENCYNIALGGQSDTGFLRSAPALYNKNTRELIKPRNIEEFKKYWDSGEYEGFSKNKILCKKKDESNSDYIFIDKNIYDKNIYETTILNKKCYRDEFNKIYFLYESDPIIIEKNLIKSGVTLGFTHTDATKKIISQKNSLSQKGERNSQYGTCWVYNTITLEKKKIKKEKLILFLEENPLWKPGYKHNNKTKEKLKKYTGKNNSQFGKCFINNGKENKKINKSEKIPNGWILGRLNTWKGDR